MENIAEKVQSLLSDEEGLKQIRSLYDVLSEKDNKTENSCKEHAEHGESHEETAGSSHDNVSDIDFESLFKLQSLFSNGMSENRNTALLNALKPHLSEERREKADRAVKILNLLETVSVLKESGLLNDLL